MGMGLGYAQNALPAPSTAAPYQKLFAQFNALRLQVRDAYRNLVNMPSSAGLPQITQAQQKLHASRSRLLDFITKNRAQLQVLATMYGYCPGICDGTGLKGFNPRRGGRSWGMGGGPGITTGYGRGGGIRQSDGT